MHKFIFACFFLVGSVIFVGHYFHSRCPSVCSQTRYWLNFHCPSTFLTTACADQAASLSRPSVVVTLTSPRIMHSFESENRPGKTLRTVCLRSLMCFHIRLRNSTRSMVLISSMSPTEWRWWWKHRNTFWAARLVSANLHACVFRERVYPTLILFRVVRDAIEVNRKLLKFFVLPFVLGSIEWHVVLGDVLSHGEYACDHCFWSLARNN